MRREEKEDVRLILEYSKKLYFTIFLSLWYLGISSKKERGGEECHVVTCMQTPK